MAVAITRDAMVKNHHERNETTDITKYQTCVYTIGFPVQDATSSILGDFSSCESTMTKKRFDIREEDMGKPMASFVDPDDTLVDIEDMGQYADIFYAMEKAVLLFQDDVPEIADDDVIAAYKALLRDFDKQEEGTLADQILMGIKVMLIMRSHRRRKKYTIGQMKSCLRYLAVVANEHSSPDGRGYLRWIKLFFEGGLPQTTEDLIAYILKNEWPISDIQRSQGG